MPDIGYYTLPVILSFKGSTTRSTKIWATKLKPAAKNAGEDYAQSMRHTSKSRACRTLRFAEA